MKTLRYLFPLLIAIVSLVNQSCKKPVDEKELNTLQVNDAQLYKIFNCDNCLITHYQDNYTLLSFDVSYNKRKDPDTLHLVSQGGAQEVATYDKLGRLNKIDFPGLPQYWKVKYDWSPLPTTMLLIVTNFADYGQTDSLNAIVYFKYNFKGELIQMKQTNAWYPGYDITYLFKYDNNGNITSIMHIPETGAPYIEYAFTSYDNKPNFITGSIWLKYMLLEAGFDPFYQLLFSKNNAKDWTWFNAFQTPGANEVFTSTFAYNNEGFANTVNLNVVDTVYGNYIGIRNSVSSCDNFATFPSLMTPLKSSNFPGMFKERLHKQLLPTVFDRKSSR